MTELLRVTDLGIRQGERTLVSGVSFAVEAGERVGLIGESGSGKSLTALAVLGLLPDGMTATGSIRVGGEEIVGAPDRVLVPLRGSRLATVFPQSSSSSFVIPSAMSGSRVRRQCRSSGCHRFIPRLARSVSTAIFSADPGGADVG